MATTQPEQSIHNDLRSHISSQVFNYTYHPTSITRHTELYGSYVALTALNHGRQHMSLYKCK